MHRLKGASRRSLSSGSVTPMEDEEDTPKRSTRGRNPLPAVSGPLFPPLPPKIPKQSPKIHLDESRPSSNTTPIPMLIPTSPSSKCIKLSSGSMTSLTPPPEDADVEEEIGNGDLPTADEFGNGDIPILDEGELAADPWEEYRRHRQVRGFSASKQVKLEPDLPIHSRPQTTEPQGPAPAVETSPRAHSVPTPSAGTTPTERAGRRRRGEGQLLLDDHLLPEEMRKTGILAGKRSLSGGNVRQEVEVENEASGSGSMTVDEAEGGVVEEGEEEEPKPIEEEVMDEDEEDSSEITRCVCNKTTDVEVFFIQCDKCNVWQHGPCMGIWGEDEAPEEYFCEECRPDLHGPLRKWIRSRGRNPANFHPPNPEDLQKFHHHNEKNPPSQSKRWLPPARPASASVKPPSRNHHRKDPSPVENHDGRRVSRGGRRGEKQASVKIEVPPPSRRVDPPVQKRKPSTTASTGGIPGASRSPERASRSPTAHSHAPPKRRSTMNSRVEAAFEDQVKAALEASRREMGEEGDEIVEDEKVEEEVEAVEDVEANTKGKGKRKRDEEELELDPIHGKNKHPNQYTYRPKPLSQPIPAIHSPIRRNGQGGTPVPPSIPPPAQHEHGTRRAGAIANGIIPAPPNTFTIHNLHWHLPDHLSQCSDLLPTPNPIALEVRPGRVVPHVPRNYYHNIKYGPGEERDEEGRLVLPNEPPPRDKLGESTTRLDPPARVRFPVRRVTTAEVKKRVRGILDYVGRVQVEEARRIERAGLMGLDGVVLPEIRERADDIIEEGEAKEVVPEVERIRPRTGPSTLELLEELAQEVIQFQVTFSSGGFGVGTGTPVPPGLAVFGMNEVETPLATPMYNGTLESETDERDGGDEIVEGVAEEGLEQVDVGADEQFTGMESREEMVSVQAEPLVNVQDGEGNIPPIGEDVRDEPNEPVLPIEADNQSIVPVETVDGAERGDLVITLAQGDDQVEEVSVAEVGVVQNGGDVGEKEKMEASKEESPPVIDPSLLALMDEAVATNGNRQGLVGG